MKKLGMVILALSVFGLLLMTQAFLGQREAREALIEASGLLGSPVRNTDGMDIGKIKQLLINPNDGHVVYAVVAVGGPLGFSETSIAIPWDAVAVAGDRETVVLTVKREVLEKAPRVAEGGDFIIGPGAEPEMENQ